MKKILFVCSCNICRSPMAEFVMKALLAEGFEAEIASAGVSGEKIGMDMDEGAKIRLEHHGIPFAPRSAVLFQGQDYFAYDMIICMDEWTKIAVEMRCFGDPEKKIRKLLDFSDRVKEGMSEDEKMNVTEVWDPYHGRNFEKTFCDIREGCLGLKKAMAK